MATENKFKNLYEKDMREFIKQKNGLSYLPWATAWSEVKKEFPDAEYTVYEQVVKIQDGVVVESRPWFVDTLTNTAWVKIGVTIGGMESIEYLPIMDFRNQSIPADKIKSTDANKSLQRALTKACARCCGIGLSLYYGEDVIDEVKKEEKKKEEEKKSELAEWNDKCFAKAKEASAIDNKATSELCKKYVPSGNPRKITDVDASKDLYEKLEAIIKKGAKSTKEKKE